MKKLLATLTACLLMTNCACANLVGDGVRIRDLTINNPGASSYSTTPYANVSLSLSARSEFIKLNNDRVLNFNSIRTNANDFFGFDAATNGLVLKQTGLYTASFFFTVRNDDLTSLAAAYATLNGKIISGSAAFLTVNGTQAASIDGTVSFSATAGDVLKFVFTSQGRFGIPAGPRKEGFKGQIGSVPWTPLSYGIIFTGKTA